MLILLMYEFPAWVLLCKSKCMSVCVSPKFKFYLLTALAWIEPLSCRTISIVMVTVLQVQEWLFCGLSMNFFMVQVTWYMKVITHLWNLKESWKSVGFFKGKVKKSQTLKPLRSALSFHWRDLCREGFWQAQSWELYICNSKPCWSSSCLSWVDI